MKEGSIVFFDGLCNLCSRSVQTILKWDKNDRYLIAPLQGKTAVSKLSDYLKTHPGTDSILLWHDNKVYSRSTAALKIAAGLTFPMNLLTIFWVFPPFIRDMVYKFIARNRYKWFGKRDACWLPEEKYTKKFLP